MNLAAIPRISLAHLPTPLEPMPRLSAELGGPEIWVKRDDCTGLSTGGNKTRKLEFLMAEAEAAGAEMVMTQGATQSNHARQTAAAAAKLGMKCHILLEDRTGSNDPNYNGNGNVLLDHLHGATTEIHPGGGDMNAIMEAEADRRRSDGASVYTIPGGGSNPTGAIGYVNAAMELVAQANDAGLSFDCILHATGSAGTQAGIVTGLRAMNANIPLLGIGVRAPKPKQEANVLALALPKRRRNALVAPVSSGHGMSSPIATMSARVTASRPKAASRRSACLPSWRACFSTRSIRQRRRRA